MHGLLTGAQMRRISVVGVFMLVMLALATHVTVARADGNTITATSITSPNDPSYFYDGTGGSYGGFTVSGTTNSTEPSSDTVDIDCYTDDGTDWGTVSPGVALDSAGAFTTTVSYASIEESDYRGVCRLRAVPAGTTPSSGLDSFAGPRVLLSYLSKSFDSYTGTQLTNYSLEAPQLGAYDTYTSLDGGEYDCPAVNMTLASPATFGTTPDSTFDCSDSENEGGDLQVDGQEPSYPDSSSESITVSASQDSSSGDLTIHEIEPLDDCSGDATGGTPPYTYTYCDAWQSDGIDDDRTIQQASDGKVVVVTDDFVSTDGQGHQVIFDSGNHVDLGINGTGILWNFPGTDGFQAYDGSASVDVGSEAPATIYAYNENYPDGSTAEGRAAITYFTAPSGAIQFSDGSGAGYAQSPVIPYTLNVPAGGSQSVSIGYATEYSQADFAADLQTELDLQTPPTITINSPAANATETSSSVNVSGSVTATTGVKSVTVDGVNATLNGSGYSATVPLSAGSNTITAVVTASSGVTTAATETVTYSPPSGTGSVTPSLQANWSGPLWLPIADTGTARAVSARNEKLGGRVTSGSAGVSYYFEYGARGHLSHQSKTMRLAASKSSQAVAVSIGGLSRGTTYSYRLVATGKYGHSAGVSRTFRVAKRGHR